MKLLRLLPCLLALSLLGAEPKKPDYDSQYVLGPDSQEKAGVPKGVLNVDAPQVQRVRAEGRVIHSGRQLATAEARLVGPDGTLYAHATTTCLVFDLPAQSRA